MVWKETTELGCGFAEGQGTKYAWEQYVVCLYSPPGNNATTKKELKANVKKFKDESQNPDCSA